MNILTLMFNNYLIKIETKFIPVSFSGTALDNIARIIGRDKSLNIPILIDRYICQDCHVKAYTKAVQKDDVTDIMATTASENPRIKMFYI